MGPSPLPSRSRLARRPRRRIVVVLRRQPILFWALALVSACTAYVSVGVALERATDGAAAYGRIVPVAVATRSLPAGAVIGPGDVDLRDAPASLVPIGALTEVPLGRSVRADVVEGEAIVAARLAPDGALGLAAALDAHERAVAVPTSGHRVPVEVGQRVDLLATVDPSLTPGRSATTVVAEGVGVLAVEDDGITVVVDLDDADRIATALATAVVTVVIAPG